MINPLKIVFMGTPDFAAYILSRLYTFDGCEIVGVYCQPDRPAGRGKNILPPPVKVKAQELNLPVYQPLNFHNSNDVETLLALKPDILAVAAYGLILPQAVLDIPSIAPLNVHASLLPFYRGAAPIQRAIMDGCEQSGVSIMHMELGLDTGPVYSMQSVDILNHTAGSLHDELAKIGAELLISVLKDMQVSKLVPEVQNNTLATYAAKLSKQDGIVDWNKPAKLVDAQIRGVTPWPGAQATLLRPQNENLLLRVTSGSIAAPKAHYAEILGCDPKNMQSGQLWLLEKNVLGVCTADNFYILHKVRPTNKGEMHAADFARGYLPQGVIGQVGILQG